MKKQLFSTLSLLFCSICVAFAQQDPKTPEQLFIQKHTLPNGVWVPNTQFSIEKRETANIDWIEYVNEIKKTQPNNYEYTLPDTTVWKGEEYGSYEKNYCNYAGFRFFPVVGVSKQQAEDFCRWRSKKVTENYAIQKNPKGILKTHDITVTYRLPTEKEWESIAQFGTTDQNGLQKPTRKQMRRLNMGNSPSDYRYRTNTKRAKNSKFLHITEYVYAYIPNTIGVHNMIGNVAEMVQEDGIAKGGSWTHTLAESTISAQQLYTKPTNWLGFRCIAEFKLTPKNATK